MLNIILLSVVMLSVVILSVVMPSVVVPSGRSKKVSKRRLQVIPEGKLSSR